MGTIPLGLLLTTSVVVVLLAAVLVAAESSLGRLSRAAVEDLIEDGKKRATRLDALLATRRATVLSARAARIALQTLATVAITLALTDTGWRWWGILLASITINWAIAYVAISLIPQHLAWRNPEGVALAVTPLLETMLHAGRIGVPVMRLLRKLVPASPQTDAEARAEMAEEMREVVDQVGETEGFDANDREMLRAVFELGHTYVREVMVPRTDMVTINADQSAGKAIALFVRSGYSRIPVIGENIDDVVGILYFKDLISRLHYHPTEREMPVGGLCRPPHFVPEMTLADNQLRRMQKERVHMVLAVDEYGGIAGLLTIEDLIEEVVGEVTDEHDRNVIEPQEIEPGVWRVPARYPIVELGELLGMELEDEDVDSVGGLLSKAMGKVPLPGAKAQALGIEMTAEEAYGRRRQVATIVARRVESEREENHEVPR
ncbi:MAG: hemolysin family protein [Actinomycetaceae bacterium]|nr:hemolysin family protein [Actinomycetaceae bacterium]